MSLTIGQVRHIAKLARLQAADDELRAMLPHLQEMVELFERLRTVDTEGLEPTSHSVPLENVWREDRAVPADCAAALLHASREARDGFFLVPGIITDDVGPRVRGDDDGGKGGDGYEDEHEDDKVDER